MTVRQFLMTLRRACGRRAGLAVAAMALGLAGPAGAAVLISQIYGAGGGAGAVIRNDYVELRNTGTAAADLTGLSLQYAGDQGINWSRLNLSGTIPAGGFFLVQLASGGSNGTVLANSDQIGTINISGSAGKLALVNGTTALAVGTECPSGATVLDFVAYGTTAGTAAGAPCTSGRAPAPSATLAIVRGSTNNSCVDNNTSGTDFATVAPTPRNSTSVPQACPSQCGPGIALTTSPTALWQQFSLACTPQASSNTVQSVLGGAVIGRLDTATYGTRWSIWKRNATNSGNVQMSITDIVAPGDGYWLYSLDAPAGGGVLIPSNNTAAATTLTSSCMSVAITTTLSVTVPCVKLSVPSATAGARLIALPVPYDVDWSKVQVAVIGSTVTTYSPTAAQAAGILANQFWIYNGTSYSTWSDAPLNVGSLRYAKSFFVKVLPGGVGQTIELRIPALGSTVLPPASDTPAAVAAVAGEPQLATQAASASGTRGAWLVQLNAKNVDTGWTADAKLGQWPGAAGGRDDIDLAALPPFSQPYLTMVFPHADWRASAGDYSADLRPANGWADKWDFEVRAQPLGSNVVLRWSAPANVLAKSRLIDRDTGLVMYPTDPNFADGYPITLDTSVRRLTWEYMGN